MKLLDLFSGIGGFHLGLEQAGFEFDWVGFSEIDKYAIKQYKRRFSDAEKLGDIKSIQPERLPDIDLVTFGFPCQDLSIAGLRGGLQANRSSLFFEAMRIIGAKKPKYFIFENVKGLFSSNEGQDFDLILRTIADFGYDGGWQLLNTRWFLPQNRERVYFVGHIRGEPRPKVFPIGEGYTSTSSKFREGDAISCIDASYYKGVDGKRTMIADYRTDEGVRIREEGDDPCLTASHHSENEPSRMQGLVIKPVLTPDRAEKRQNGRRFKDDGEDMFTLTSQDQHGVMISEPKILDDYNNKIREDGTCGTITQHCSRSAPKNGMKVVANSSIRRLTPTECERLQGFPDGWTEGQSDTQRYKQLGNAVSVPVVKAVGERLIKCLG